MLAIAAGSSICTVAPSVGGSIASWEVGGQPMLRSAAPGHDVLGSASFPLIPYSNRIGFGGFGWNGREVQLPAHPLAAPHAIHGVGWEEGWDVIAHGASSITIELEFAGDARWPWPFRATQTVEVDGESLMLSLVAINLADEPAPLAFGHHPYFDASGAQLQFAAESFYPTVENNLPGEARLPAGDEDFSSVRPVPGKLIDNIYGNWHGPASIAWTGRPRALQITSSLPHAVLYTPPGEDFFCFEPVPHLTNALNRADGDMPIIAPGGAFSGSIKFHAIAA